jgi:DNA (cytosine-5)-methyltransferase 1
MNYYNEWDSFAADWLRELIKDGLIPDGEVDNRSIADVRPEDLRGFTQCHFFAGIGGWSRALQIAGWSSDRSVWTGSPPCQPFSSAGKKSGGSDDRDLWPVWFDLIRELKPSTIFGEQVGASIRYGWLDRTQIDLESSGYAVGAIVLPAASIGAAHRRERLWFVADSGNKRREGFGDRKKRIINDGERDALGDSDSYRPEPGDKTAETARHRRRSEPASFWTDSEFIRCYDGKKRTIPTEPALFPLADGIPNRVGILRGAGNAIVPQAAAEIIKAYLGND